MGFDRDSATSAAKRDIARRLGVSEAEVSVSSVSEKDFPDMSLGAPENGEMSAQMISTGWEIKVGAAGKTYEYRADKYQLRLKGFEGRNHLVKA
ncbi:MAG: hypothetical protein KIT61_00855 [Pyrinomonadaceae bacterium]|nr:hypothetical protein [Blastocatellia bacterium]MCW5955101.1 hypothetical protein [Pyrinomonadaceae bacterium]